MTNNKAEKVLFGGDYNPEQWDENIVKKDIELFEKAGVNTLTLPVFAWAKLEPKEGCYDFDWLDKILDQLDEKNFHYFLATPTSAQPGWMSKEYPQVLPVDISGRKRTHGMRVFFCYNSKKYRERAAAIASQMAVRYGTRPGLIGWHVANEYGTYCYCSNCQKKYRQWLMSRYHSLDNLNVKWNTAFWGRTVTDIDEVMVPSELNDDYRFCPSNQLDYLRFITDSIIECYENEADILKKETPDLPVFTNISGYVKKLDQFKMVSHMDCAGWDNYPSPKDKRSLPAFKHDLMRGLKQGESFYIMEQSPNQQNWQPYNKLKRPGETKRLAFQGIAHGADSSLYFQMRQSVAGQEKFHGALISHNGKDNTRVFSEMSSIGRDLKKLKNYCLQAKTESKVGIVFDWENWWALELCSGPSIDMNYLDEVHYYYQTFYYENIAVDILSYNDDFEKYDLIVAPMLYMMKDGIDKRICNYVKEGGTLIGTYMTGYADDNDRCIFGAYPGPLKEVFGIEVEETDALYQEEQNGVVFITDGLEKVESCHFLCDLIHINTAETLAVYKKDFYKGIPAVTSNSFGKGKAYYLGTRISAKGIKSLILSICRQLSIYPPFQTKGKIEVTVRNNEKLHLKIMFVINHGCDMGQVDFGNVTLYDLISEKKYQGVTEVEPSRCMVLISDSAPTK